jgi:hypothetical protein
MRVDFMPPNKLPEPTAVGAGRSAVAVDSIVLAWHIWRSAVGMEGGFLFVLLLSLAIMGVASAAPTDNFTQVPFTYDIQYPYNLQLSDRYAVTNSTNYFWVYSTDEPFESGSTTLPRTEMRIYNDYTSGVWQFEGDLFVPSGTTGVAVMQVFGGSTSSTSLQLRVYNGSLCRYTTPILNNIYNTWIHVNVIHDANAHTVAIYLNGNFIRSDADRGPSTYYFKCGVYEQDSPSLLMQSQWANIKVWEKTPQIRNLTVGNNVFVLTATNGTPGDLCFVLATTNLNVPIADWTYISANNFDSNGSFILTNGIDPTVTQQYYRLQSSH